MLLGALCTLLGYQTLWLGIHSKVFGHRIVLLPADALTRALDDWFMVERGLVLGGGVFATGFGANLWLVVRWNTSRGELDVSQTLRGAL